MRRTLDGHLGVWVGTWSTWLQPDVLYDVSALEMSVVTQDAGWMLSYEGDIATDRASGSMYYRFDRSMSRITWTDSWHTGGDSSDLIGMGDDPAFYAYTDGSEPWGWTIDVEPREERLLITHRNIPPGGRPARAVSVRLRRDQSPFQGGLAFARSRRVARTDSISDGHVLEAFQ